MNMSDIRIPAPERPEPRRSAVDFINEINAQLVWIEHQKKPEQAVRISYGGAFGVMRAVRITPQGSDVLSILVRDGEGGEHTIVAPVSQCSFMISVFIPTAEEPAEKVILGFAEGAETSKR